MNNIYKVIWSKAKNCYVVASEIARSHTKSATGSRKIGGVTRRSLLASLMALSLLCGGLGVASAVDVVHVDESASGGIAGVYTTTKVDTELGKKADKTDVEEIKNTVGGVDSGLVKKTNDNATGIEVNRTSINALKDTVGDDTKGLTKKINDNATAINTLTTNVNAKADANTVNDISTRVGTLETTVGNDTGGLVKDVNEAKTDITNIKNTIGDASNGLVKNVAALETKVGDASSGLVKDVADLKTQGSNLTNALGNKADQSDLDAAKAKITTNETNITALQKKTTGLSDDGKSLTSMNNVETGALKVTGEISNGTVNTTLEKIAASMEQTKTNKEDIANLKTTTNGQQTAIDKLNEKTTQISYDPAQGTTVNGVDFKDAEVDANGKGLTGVTTLNTTGAATIGGALKADSLIVENASHLKGDVTMDKTLSVTGDTSLKKTDVDGALNAKDNVILGTNAANTVTVNGKSDFKAAVEMDKGLTVTSGDTTLQNTDVKGALNVTGESNLKNTTVDGTLSVNKETTLNDKLTANGEATFGNDVTVKGTTNLKGTTVDGDLKVTGTITTDRMVFGDPATNNYTEIDHGKVTSKNSVVNGEGQKITSSSIFNAEKNKVGFANNATGDQSFHKQTSDIIMDNVKDRDNSNYRTQTKTETKDIITDKDGNSSTTSQTASENKTYLKDKDGKNTNSTIDTAKGYDKTIKGENGETSTKQDELNITNTAQKGTIKNDAMNIENNASGNITNKANTMDTNVTGKATESYGSLDTTVNGNETHIVKGTKTETVDGKVTENYGNGQETNVTGDQDINVSGTQTTTATDINRNASSSMVDKVDNAYGTNTETKVAGKTTTDVSIKGTGEKGQYIRGANESRDYLIKGTLKNSETKTVEKTSTEITDGTNKASTIQDAKNLAGSVTNGTETGVSGIHANDNSVSIDSIVTDGNKYSVINQKKGSIQSTVVDGTNSTVILQDKDNVTIASSNGTVAIGGKDIVNNAQDTITNTAGTKITDKVGTNTRVIDSTSITDTVGTANRKIEDGKITDTAGDSTVTTENGKGTTFAKAGSAAYSTEAGATKDTNIAGNHITTGRVDANELGVSDKDDQGNTADLSVKAGEGIKSSATDKDGNTTYTKVTATENSFQVQDKDGKNKNHQVNTKDKSENTITNGDKTNTVTSTADGTTFNNSKANTAFEGGTYTDTTIKGNTITTGKVTMDYAEVMKDLGVHGNAKVDQNLEVGGTSTLKGDVTMESNATVKKDLKVEGTTTTKTLKVTENATVGGTLDVTQKATFHDDVDIKKNLSVDGNATIAGDVTAKSYKVGDKTYIDANGIHANDQKITNVADGSISEGSKDAVNGGQLYGVKRDLEHQVDKVGANAAAMANLRPMEFDPSSKWNIAAAIGNYGSETAAALGAFYRPNDDVMVNLSTAFGTGENMVGGGVSVRLGKGGNKLSREENNALKAQVDDLTARMDALLSVLNPNMSKDFPDVPENHWAYEAVSRLAGNDIVQGYPDGEFHGERTMTRYEMAEIIYNALSRGAEAERELVEEFKPELQAMAASEKATAEKAEG